MPVFSPRILTDIHITALANRPILLNLQKFIHKECEIIGKTEILVRTAVLRPLWDRPLLQISADGVAGFGGFVFIYTTPSAAVAASGPHGLDAYAGIFQGLS